MLPFWNALSFFTSYAEVDQITPEEIQLDACSLEDLDRYILSELEIMVRDVTSLLEGYRVHEAMRLFPSFLDTLNNWYIRRSRERVWSQEARNSSKVAFYSTVYDVLTTFAKLVAPFCPFVAEMVWERLGHAESVHLSDWPKERAEYINETLSAEVSTVRQIVSAGLSVRAREKLRVRLPLASAKVAVRAEAIQALRSYEPILCGELNVKKIEFLADASEIAVPQAKINARLVGPKLGNAMQGVMQKIRAGDFQVLGKDSIKVGDIILSDGEVDLGFVGKEGLAVESIGGLVVALDSEVTKELEREGFARDLVREIQDMRKMANLHIADRIVLGLSGVDDILNHYKNYIQSETLCVEVKEEVTEALVERSVDLGGAEARISLILSS
jgi:isoleucyl-tRNA synthetase